MNKGNRKNGLVARTSANVMEERLTGLKEIFPEIFIEGKVDLEKLQAMLGEEADSRPERYSFTWAGKRDAIRLLQTLSRATLIPCPGESVNFESTSNLFIEGDNLEVMKLLYKSYFGQVKMIYIDPPYNTGTDKIYPDNFSDPLETYLRLTGQKAINGDPLTTNKEKSGRYHSSWLSMMYPRLFMARHFLREDGLIFISIDDHEVYNLRLLMNIIFGEESFLATFIWRRRQMADSRNLDRASTDHEYIISYRNPKAVLRGKDIDTSKYSNPDNDPRGPWFSADLTGLATKERRPNLHYDVVNPVTGVIYKPSPTRGWSYSRATFQKYIEENRILWPTKPEGRPRFKKFYEEVNSFQTGFSSILNVGFTTEGTREIQELFGEKVFLFPKPTSLIKTLIIQSTNSNDIILDLFAGTCTTAQAVLESNREDGGNRRFIMIQMPEPTGKEDFHTFADIGKERIRRVISKMNNEKQRKLDLTDRETPEDLGFKVFKLAESNYKQWPGLKEKEPESYVQQMELFTDPLVEGWQPGNVMWEVIIKEGLGLNARIEPVEVSNNTIYRVTDSDKGQSFLICLDGKLEISAIKALGLCKDDLFICLDLALDDETAANLALQCRLKTI